MSRPRDVILLLCTAALSAAIMFLPVLLGSDKPAWIVRVGVSAAVVIAAALGRSLSAQK